MKAQLKLPDLFQSDAFSWERRGQFDESINVPSQQPTLRGLEKILLSHVRSV